MYLHLTNDGILTERIGALLGGIGAIGPLLLTSLLGGLACALGMLTGFYARRNYRGIGLLL